MHEQYQPYQQGPGQTADYYRGSAPHISYHQGPMQQAPRFGESPTSAAHWLLPTGRSWQSIVAGYVALFALVVWPLGPLVGGLGIWALRTASRQGSHGRGRAIFAIVVGAVTTGLSIVLLMFALFSG